MYLSRITPFRRGDRMHRLVALAGKGPYGIHQALWRLFDNGTNTPRDFLYRQTGEAHALGFYVLSAREPGTDEDLWIVESKRFQPRLDSGQRLRFSVRINPVVKRRDDNRRQQRHDLVMDLKTQDRTAGVERTQAERVQSAALAWMEQRQERNGFALDSGTIVAQSYRQLRFRGKGGRVICLSTLDCEGVLKVEDAEQFQKTLENGLGPAKAFGCGLLLIRPA